MQQHRIWNIIFVFSPLRNLPVYRCLSTCIMSSSLSGCLRVFSFSYSNSPSFSISLSLSLFVSLLQTLSISLSHSFSPSLFLHFPRWPTQVLYVALFSLHFHDFILFFRYAEVRSPGTLVLFKDRSSSTLSSTSNDDNGRTGKVKNTGKDKDKGAGSQGEKLSLKLDRKSTRLNSSHRR